MLLRFKTLIIMLLLSACASSPTIDSSGVDRTLSPRSVVAAPEMARGKDVLWGGVIIHTNNLQDSTQIEVLAYPLDTKQRPLRDSDPLGRFILDKTGYLEPESYAEGRLVSVVGTVSGTRAGKVGETVFDFPVISARQVTLWPKGKGGEGSGINFGIGVGFGL